MWWKLNNFKEEDRVKKTILTKNQKEKIQTVYLITENHKIIPFGIFDDIQPEIKLTRENFKALWVLNDTLYEFTIEDFDWFPTCGKQEDFYIKEEGFRINRRYTPIEVSKLLDAVIRERMI